MSSEIAGQRVLVTGGTGYIGSHACVALAEAGCRVVVLDNLCNSSIRVLDRIAQICGQRPAFVQADIRDREALRALFARYRPDAVLHFAGLKSVGESVAKPELYRDNNVTGTRILLDVMREEGVRTLVFSSSATVYGEPQFCPVTEQHPLGANNPYGQTKLEIEDLLRELRARQAGWRIALLRYFNPVGAHPSGLIGEDPSGVPNNLMPFIAQVAVGRRQRLQVFGGDYDTVDGTGVRDYIHVLDLVAGHLSALEHLAEPDTLITVNLGTGRGVSVLQLLQAFERASGVEIPYEIVARRPGDSAANWADPALAQRLLGWRASRGVEAMCLDTWNWQRRNPQGYETGQP